MDVALVCSIRHGAARHCVILARKLFSVGVMKARQRPTKDDVQWDFLFGDFTYQPHKRQAQFTPENERKGVSRGGLSTQDKQPRRQDTLKGNQTFTPDGICNQSKFTHKLPEPITNMLHNGS